MNTRRTATAFALALAATLLAPIANAQTDRGVIDEEKKGVVPLSQQPYAIPSLGVSLSLPEGAYARTFTVAGEKAHARILPGDSQARWQLAIKSHKSSNEQLTNTDALDSVIQQIKLTRPVHNPEEGQIDPKDVLNKNFKYSRIVIKSRQKDLDINGIPAERVYLTAPNLPDYPDAGITILNPEPGEFLLVHLECPSGTLESHKPLFEVVSASVRFRDKSELNADRAARVLATHEIFQSVNAQDLEALLDEEPRFFRLFKPGPSGRQIDDMDIAWQRTEVRIGQAGELNPGKSKTRWSASDREYGFILQIEGRAIWKGGVIDSQGIFYLSRDRANERWSLKNTIRGDGEPSTTSQTLIRKDDKINYIVERPGEPRYQGEFLIPERGYLSKVESVLFSRVIASRDIPGEFAYYIFDPGLDTIVLRHETFQHDDAGNWLSTLKPFENAPPQEILYNEEGRLVRRTAADGQLMEPVDPQKLRRIWDRKDLPVD